MNFVKIVLAGSFLLISATFTGSFSSSVQAHEGEIDSMGCHYARTHKNYHCHKGKLKDRTFKSRAEAIRNYNRIHAPKKKDDDDDDGYF